MTVHGWSELTWDKKGNLIFQKEIMAHLVPHKEHPKMYHIKFAWRDEETPEFFNLINAKENARGFTLGKLNNMVKIPTETPLGAF